MLDFQPRDPRAPDKTIARFMLKPVHMEFQSQKEGRPIYEDREFVEIISPGLAKSIPCEEVTDEHKQRWPREYAAFSQGLEVPVSGTPLEQWAAVSPGTVMTLKALHIRTVEDLAAISDSAIQNLGTGGRELREKAIRWLASATSSAPLEEAIARAEKAESDAKFAHEQIDALAARLEALEARKADEAAERRGPGRPPKQHQEAA